tara:strand:+ start:144 stop:410 length:267 start_codon:yes stop_codon:yes gene_type:complete
MKKMTKKGVFDQMGALAIGVATLVITLAVVFLLLAKVAANSDVVASSNASAAVAQLTNDTYSIVTWVGLVIIVAIGVLILGLVRMIRQ